MLRKFILLSLILATTACNSTTNGTNPFMEAENTASTITDTSSTINDATTTTTDVNPDDYTTPTTDETVGINTDGLAPPEVANIDQNTASIARAQGEANGYNYDTPNDYLYINNLPYDGLETDPYIRYALVPTGDNFAIYQSISSVEDSKNETVSIPQDAYRAVYGTSASGGSQLVIVKTGAYAGDGFGGYVYQRQAVDHEGNSMEFIMPTSGQALLSGDYQGLIVYEPGLARLDHVKGTAKLTIDFKDFDNSPALWFQIIDRTIYDDSGIDASDQFTTVSVANDDGSSSTYHVDVTSIVAEKSLTTSGEFSGELLLSEKNGSGHYYGILSGENADEAVGIVELQWQHPQSTATTVRETGGFIITR